MNLNEQLDVLVKDFVATMGSSDVSSETEKTRVKNGDKLVNFIEANKNELDASQLPKTIKVNGEDVPNNTINITRILLTDQEKFDKVKSKIAEDKIRLGL